VTAVQVPHAPARPHGSAVRLRDVQVQYGGVPVLRNVTLDLAHGERVALVGTSGGGKTTLLRTLAGLTPHSAITDCP